MMDLSVRPHVGMPAVRVLNIPMEIFLPPAGRRVGTPLVALGIQIATLGAARWVLQPIPTQRRDIGTTPASGKKFPGIFERPVISWTHVIVAVIDRVDHTFIVPGAGSRATNSRPSACRSAISSVAMATKSSVSATMSGLKPKRSLT